MKRLTDELVAQYQESAGAGRLNEGPLDAVFRDHLQAREDVKRGAELLRACATEAPDGTLCWCGDGDLNAYCWHSPQGRSLSCIERSTFLSEVGQ